MGRDPPVMVGVFGGTFDPIHTGHLAIANDVAQAFGLASVLFVPNSRSPLRQAPVASPIHRFEMCRLATSENPDFAVSRVDIDRDGPSYAVDTLKLLRTDYPDSDFALIAGSDVVDELRGWRDTTRLLKDALMIVVDRTGFERVDVNNVATDLAAPGRIVRHRATPLDVSSTEIRKRIAGGLPYRHFLHPLVYDYIRGHGIYDVTLAP